MACAPSVAAAGEPVALQPDGKIVVAGGVTPGFGMLARLKPDGSLDPSFGDGGFVVDRKSAPFTDLALQPDGKIVALSASLRLKRFLPDGSLDLGFGEEGVAVRLPSPLEGPAALALLPDGRIALGGNYHIKLVTHQALAFAYGEDGRSVEQVGKIGPVSDFGSEAENPSGWLGAMAPLREGALLMAGSYLPNFYSSEGGRSVLARFVPGTGLPYDPRFGGGVGLVTIPYPGAPPTLNALTQVPSGIYGAGAAAGHIILGRVSGEGALDGGFGEGGFASASPGRNVSQGNGLFVQSDGKVVVGGETMTREGRTRSYCRSCRNPLLARFLPDGQLDTAFGQNGIAFLASADGHRAAAMGEAVAGLPDGRMLIAGTATSRHLRVLIGRFLPEGKVDRSFGEGGIATVDACPGSAAVQRRSRCLPSARTRFRFRRSSRGRVALHLGVRPNLGWASVAGLRLTLPPQLRVAKRSGRRIRVKLLGSDGRRRSVRVAAAGRRLHGYWSTGAKSISLSVPPGVLQTVRRRHRERSLPFRLRVWFRGPIFGYESAGVQTLVLRRVS